MLNSPATGVGSFFVSQYYPVLQQQPEATHQFYTDASSVVRVDGDSSESGSGLGQIHTLIMSRIFTNVHIKTINSLESWNGGVHLVVSGFVKSTDFTGRRNFVQSFFLAPQEKGYFVLNDIFNLIGDEVIDQSPEIAHSDDIINSQPKISEPVGQEPASDYPLEEEAREYVESVHIEAAHPVEEYKFEEHQHEPEAEYEAEQEETQVEEPADFHPIVTEAAHEPRLAAIEEPSSEPQKFSYASILLAQCTRLRAAKGKPAPPVIVQRPTKSKMPVSDSHVHQSSPAEPVIQNSTSDIGEEGLSHESGETKSVYVKNLPLTATTLDILQEFQNFGKIKKDGVFLRQKRKLAYVSLLWSLKMPKVLEMQLRLLQYSLLEDKCTSRRGDQPPLVLLVVVEEEEVEEVDLGDEAMVKATDMEAMAFATNEDISAHS
ncbi:hypothetical protein Leryth_015972 [Lithospermum erythrorhizon]|nr:hypothetical protein Leryth_015972 [Lithospermum erythrorhizon]